MVRVTRCEVRGANCRESYSSECGVGAVAASDLRENSIFVKDICRIYDGKE